MNAGPIGAGCRDCHDLHLSFGSISWPGSLAITGDPGIDKSEVWKHAVPGVYRSSRVLFCQPASAEPPLAFSALDDLLGDDAKEVHPSLLLRET
jgi:hypothetical protein